ncbi:hypothetical protein [Lacinutrix himadriensis]|uniref:hypothetical protein n=1 Tax=Lacinutrix himadriensis TaxID=641549 RepID=UPI0006E16F2F|nr:hypothetical protein [Lacinutrix himadriensis]
MDMQVITTKMYKDTRFTTVELLEQLARVGDLRAGGVVFWVDPKDNTHGLVCALEDQSDGIRWGTSAITSANALSIGRGADNTKAIIATNYNLEETSYAAGLTRAYRGGGFEDWYLPSDAELHEMYQNRVCIDKTAIANGGQIFFNSGNTILVLQSLVLMKNMPGVEILRLAHKSICASIT